MNNQIVTYESKNASNPDMRWAAYVVLANGTYWGVMFTDATEDGAITKARELWESERKRAPYPSRGPIDEDAPDIDEAPKAPRKASQPRRKVSSDGRGAHFSGTAWMIHKDTREKVRIPKEQVAAYTAKGYVPGGPRSK